MPSVIVIGAGVFGASVADRLARSGWDVILVDRHEPGDPRSESGGETRLIRCSHGPDAFYARSARRALPIWRELGVVEEVGVVWFARGEDGWEAESESVLRAQGIPVERMAPDEAARLYPGVRVDDLAFVLHEHEAGALRARDGVRALVARAHDAGPRLLRADARPEGAAVRTAEELLEGDAVVWACGAWLAGLFGELLPLRVTLQELVLFDVPVEWRGPGWVDFDAAFYGHGRIDPFGFKAGPDVDGPAVDPDERPLTARPSAVAAAREYLAHRFPAISEAPLASAPGCHYSLTADGEFLFDRHPEHEDVWLLGGGSGHGYKHGPALAEHVEAVLAGRAAQEPRFALGERKLSRSLRTAGFGRGGGRLAADQS